MAYSRAPYLGPSSMHALTAGEGRFSDDINRDGQLYAVFVRTEIAHGEITGIDLSDALRMPGVEAIFTHDDIEADGISSIPPLSTLEGAGGARSHVAPIPVMADRRCRYVGEAIAIVIARSVSEAQDAAEVVSVSYNPLSAASSIAAATESADPIWEDAPGNLALDWLFGDADEVDQILDGADTRIRTEIVDQRIAGGQMEPGAAIGDWDQETQVFTLIAPTQGVGPVRMILASKVLHVAPENVRVITPDVGGAFGIRAQLYPEHVALLHAARRLRRPVKWTATRTECFLATTHGRDGLLAGELALDSKGRILALKVDIMTGIGPYVAGVTHIIATENIKNCLSSVYRIPEISCRSRLIYTNAAPLGPYRGAGRPEAILLVERLIEEAATVMGLDSAELRRLNMIPTETMPYQAATGMVYDSGAFEQCLELALELADWAGFEKRRQQSIDQGKLRGIGIGCLLEVAGGMLLENAQLVFEKEGVLTLRLPVQDMGQGHRDSFPRLVAQRLGIAPEKVRLVTGDTALVPMGGTSVASRSAMMAGSAIHNGIGILIEKGIAAASDLLEASPEDIEFANGEFVIRGTDSSVGLFELADKLSEKSLHGAYAEECLDSAGHFASPVMTFPNGCHICEVEIQPETGEVEIIGYVSVDDFGNVLNEEVVRGQVYGAVVQGLGQVLGEQIVYDADGQLLSASFMDYFMPRAEGLPNFTVEHVCVPCTTNPLGVKGAGESGVAGALAACTNAIVDALPRRSSTPLSLPFTPQRIWADWINDRDAG